MTELRETEKINKGKVALMFTATWCGPCRMLKPSIEVFSKSQKEIDVYSVDVDDAQDIAGRFGIKSVPTLVALFEGQIVNILHGQNINANNIKNSYAQRI